MHDAVKEADKIVCEYLKRMGYATATKEKKSNRLVLRITLLLTFLVMTLSVILKLTS